jgi:cell wall-associated NlpC family hydrolase
MMRIGVKATIAMLSCLLALSLPRTWAESGSAVASNTLSSNTVRPGSTGNRAPKPVRTLSEDDRLSVIAAALDPKVRQHSARDCSHLVHGIYERAGFAYSYASSSDLYKGVEGFQRIPRPQPGDLVVWRGHVGIVIRPSRHVFFSLMTSGPGIDDYQAPYWASRGQARFFRYVKNDPCPGCGRSQRLD